MLTGASNHFDYIARSFCAFSRSPATLRQEQPRVLCVGIPLRTFVSITNEIITRTRAGSAQRLINLSGKPVQNKPSKSLWKNLGRVPIAAKP